MAWVPRSIRGNAEAEKTYETLEEGVPGWLRTPLWGWVASRIASQTDVTELLLLVQSALRRELDFTYGTAGAEEDLRNQFDADDDFALDVVDLLLLASSSEDGERLDFILQVAGSVWRVGDGEADRLELQRRIDSAVAEGADNELRGVSNASAHLRRAWSALYGRAPNPALSYSEAVKAIEAASKATLLPTDAVYTLGKGIIAMRNKPDKWTVAIDHPEDDNSLSTIIAMAETVWRRQHNRHGSDDHDLDVTMEAAEVALHLALTLVHVFSSGRVRRAN
jgi:hypothetical protein